MSFKLKILPAVIAVQCASEPVETAAELATRTAITIAKKKDAIVRQVVEAKTGERLNRDQLKERGSVRIFTDGREVFIFDNVALVEFYPLTEKAEPTEYYSAEVSLEQGYRVLFDESEPKPNSCCLTQ